MSSSHSSFFRGRFVSGLFLLAFSVTVLFLILNQVPSLPVVRGAVRLAANSTTFVETPTYVVIVATTTTTATSLSTSMVTTTSVDTTTVLQTLTQTMSTTSTSVSVAGIGGLEASMNIPLVIVAAVIGAILGAVGITKINTTKSNSYRSQTSAHAMEKRTMKPGSFCDKCGGPAKDSICVGCGRPTATCTCAAPASPVRSGTRRLEDAA